MAAGSLHSGGALALLPEWPASVLRKHRDVFDIYTIIFLALAVFIFLRLRSVLGQRTGRERPPFDPYSRDTARPASEKVITLPNRAPEAAAKPAEPAVPGERWKGIAEPGTPMAQALDGIARAEPSFEPAFPEHLQQQPLATAGHLRAIALLDNDARRDG